MKVEQLYVGDLKTAFNKTLNANFPYRELLKGKLTQEEMLIIRKGKEKMWRKFRAELLKHCSFVDSK